MFGKGISKPGVKLFAKLKTGFVQIFLKIKISNLKIIIDELRSENIL